MEAAYTAAGVASSTQRTEGPAWTTTVMRAAFCRRRTSWTTGGWCAMVLPRPSSRRNRILFFFAHQIASVSPPLSPRHADPRLPCCRTTVALPPAPCPSAYPPPPAVEAGAFPVALPPPSGPLAKPRASPVCHPTRALSKAARRRARAGRNSRVGRPNGTARAPSLDRRPAIGSRSSLAATAIVTVRCTTTPFQCLNS